MPRRLRKGLFLAASCAILASAPLAHADGATSAEARALAVQLFDEGDRLMQAKQFAQACAKLAESHRLDPQLGALLYLAECYEANDRLASAWGSFREGEELALRRGDDRAQAAGARARALEARLNRMLFELPSDARELGYQIERNGLTIAPALWDTAIAVDAGSHRIVVSKAGYEPWSADIDVQGEAQRVVVQVPPLSKLPPPAPRQEAEAGTSQRLGAIALGGLGLIGLGVGGVFALNAQAAFSDSNELCNANDVCQERGVELRDDAQDAALVSTVSSALGGAALVGALILWFTAPDSSSEHPNNASAKRLRLSMQRNRLGLASGLELRGRF